MNDADQTRVDSMLISPSPEHTNRQSSNIDPHQDRRDLLLIKDQIYMDVPRTEMPARRRPYRYNAPNSRSVNISASFETEQTSSTAATDEG